MSKSEINPRGHDRTAESESKPILTSGVLGKRIAIEYAKPFPHKHGILKPGFNSFIVTGASGSGKSTFILSLLPYFARLNAVIYATRMPNNDLFDAIGRWASQTKRDPLPPEIVAENARLRGESKSGEDKTEESEEEPKRIRFHVVYSPDELSAVVDPIANSQKSGPDRGYWSVVIFDDFSLHRGPADKYRAAGVQASAVLRNMGFHNIHISQQYSKMIDTSIRTNANNIVAFGMHDKHAIDALMHDMSPLYRQFTPEGIRYLFDEICSSLHGYLWMILDGGHARLYRYLDDRGGLQRVETPDERRQRDLDEESTPSFAVAMGRGRRAKLGALRAEYDRAIDEKNGRLARVLQERIRRLSIKAQEQSDE